MPSPTPSTRTIWYLTNDGNVMAAADPRLRSASVTVIGQAVEGQHGGQWSPAGKLPAPVAGKARPVATLAGLEAEPTR